MFALVLWLHSMIRWAVVVPALVALYRAWSGRAGHRPWTLFDRGVLAGFAALLDLQLVIGGVLWFKSPISILGIHELDLGLADPVLRFWTFTHPILMLAAIVVVHAGLVRIRRLQDSAQRHRIAFVYVGLSLVLVFAGSPWSFLAYGRPLMSPLP